MPEEEIIFTVTAHKGAGINTKLEKSLLEKFQFSNNLQIENPSDGKYVITSLDGGDDQAIEVLYHLAIGGIIQGGSSWDCKYPA